MYSNREIFQKWTYPPFQMAYSITGWTFTDVVIFCLHISTTVYCCMVAYWSLCQNLCIWTNLSFNNKISTDYTETSTKTRINKLYSTLKTMPIPLLHRYQILLFVRVRLAVSCCRYYLVTYFGLNAFVQLFNSLCWEREKLHTCSVFSAYSIWYKMYQI